MGVKSSILSRPNGLFLFRNCGNSFEGFWRHGAYKNGAHEWRDNPDTKSTKNQIKKKTLIGFLKSYYGNYALGREHPNKIPFIITVHGGRPQSHYQRIHTVPQPKYTGPSLHFNSI